jgi:putative colanic acid biosynthesis acetyltransferase WcaF
MSRPRSDPARPGGDSPLRLWLWRVVQASLFRYSFHNSYGFRCRLLRLFGATLAAEVRIRPTVRIDCPWRLTIGRKSSLGDGCVVWAHAPVAIGERSVCSQFTMLSTWEVDAERPDRVAPPRPIHIGDDVWIAAECMVAAGVTVPPGVVVGARSVVREPLEPWTIATGDPARSRAARTLRSGEEPESEASAR